MACRSGRRADRQPVRSPRHKRRRLQNRQVEHVAAVNGGSSGNKEASNLGSYMAAVGVPLYGLADMAYFPSQQACQGTGFAYDDLSLQSDQSAVFDLSDYILFDEGLVPASFGWQEGSAVTPMVVEADQTASQISGSNLTTASSSTISRSEVERLRMAEGSRIAFRTKSEVEILNDGFKWRKYGKKSVKNSPNPRNYYRCSTEGCPVKKRVERDKEDPSYVITTYDGKHNHMSPGVVYYTTQDSASGRFYVAGCELPPGS